MMFGELVPGNGFFLEMEYRTYGKLVLPVKDADTQALLHPRSKKTAAPKSQLHQLEQACRQYADDSDDLEGYRTAQSFADRYPPTT